MNCEQERLVLMTAGQSRPLDRHVDRRLSPAPHQTGADESQSLLSRYQVAQHHATTTRGGAHAD